MDIKALIRYVEIDNNGNLTFRKKPKCEFNQMKVIVLTARHPLRENSTAVGERATHFQV